MRRSVKVLTLSVAVMAMSLVATAASAQDCWDDPKDNNIIVDGPIYVQICYDDPVQA